MILCSVPYDALLPNQDLQSPLRPPALPDAWVAQVVFYPLPPEVVLLLLGPYPHLLLVSPLKMSVLNHILVEEEAGRDLVLRDP